MGANPYCPDRGDLIWISLEPRMGHEQAGTRPALVLSPRAYNRKTSLALCCPVTSKAKGYPFEVALPENSKIEGVVLADQVRNIDWRVRGSRKAGSVPSSTFDEVIKKTLVLLL